jgi:transcriptional regulator with XRE-family HTH domain
MELPMPRHSPTLRRRRLSAELRRLRAATKMTAAQIDGRLGWNEGKLARMERGDWLRPNPRDIADLLEIYGITDVEQRDYLITLARQGRERGWWHPYRELSPTYFTYIGLEQEASAVRTFQLSVTPGLLQTEDYARALIARGPGEIDEDEIERQVEVRAERQKLLTADDPMRLWAIIDEAALRRPVGDEDVMRGQLAQLLEMARLPKVTLQVIPFAAGAHPGLLSAFTLLEFPHPDDPDAAYVQTVGSELFLEDDDVTAYRIAFERLTAYALSPTDTLPFIANLAM